MPRCSRNSSVEIWLLMGTEPLPSMPTVTMIPINVLTQIPPRGEPLDAGHLRSFL